MWNWIKGNHEPATAIATIVGAVLAFFATVAAWRAAESSKAQVVYAAKVQAISNFARASETYSSAMRVATFDIPEAVYYPDRVVNMPDEDVFAAAKIGREVINAQALYLAEMDAQATLWPSDISAAIAKSMDAARGAAWCSLRLGGRAGQKRPETVVETKKQIIEACRGGNNPEVIMAFEKSFADVLGKMSTEVKATAK